MTAFRLCLLTRGRLRQPHDVRGRADEEQVEFLRKGFLGGLDDFGLSASGAQPIGDGMRDLLGIAEAGLNDDQNFHGSSLLLGWDVDNSEYRDRRQTISASAQQTAGISKKRNQSA